MNGSGIRSRRRKLVEGIERSLSDLLHERMAEAFRREHGNDRRPPSNTSALYVWAKAQAPAMLEQLYSVHLEAMKERGEIPRQANAIPVSDEARKRMLSAVRASVAKTQNRFYR